MGEFAYVSSSLHSILPHFISRHNSLHCFPRFTASRELSVSFSSFHNLLRLQNRQTQGFSVFRVSVFAINSVSGRNESPIQSDSICGSGSGKNNDEFCKSDTRSEEEKKKGFLFSKSQTRSLIFAMILGAGGLMRFIETGSKKSLAACGSSALLIWYMHGPFPAMKWILRLGVSAALLSVCPRKFHPMTMLGIVIGFYLAIKRYLH